MLKFKSATKVLKLGRSVIKVIGCIPQGSQSPQKFIWDGVKTVGRFEISRPIWLCVKKNHTAIKFLFFGANHQNMYNLIFVYDYHDVRL